EPAFALFEAIDAEHRAVFGSKAQLTGQGVLGQTVNRALVHHFASGALLALALVFLVLVVGLRSLRSALQSVLPNLIPLALVLGVMGLVGIDLRYTSAVVLTVVFAIAVDDTVHFLSVARGNAARGLEKAGPSILVTSMVLAAGFGVLLASDFLPNRVMGLLFATTAVGAVIGDLFALPALMTLTATRPKSADV
ncbi:MAG: putative RND superfamily exporter protein, partial [Myxococcota bacterium]